MYKILVSILITIPLMADFFPKTTTTTISKVDEHTITLKKALPKVGMSCAIVHNYGNNINALIHMAKQVSKDGKIKLIDSDIIHHDNIPTINTKPHVGDKVIGGYLYSNILLLAPNEQTYENITKTYNKKWIHPDLFAMFLSQDGSAEPTKETLKAFAKRYQVGLIMIVQKNKIVLYDPLSQEEVASKAFKPQNKQTKYPFYMHFKEIESGWFSKKDGDYYKTMERF
jgi:hypothetical protein